jgi:phosphonate degradation associated HDIG domain protein
MNAENRLDAALLAELAALFGERGQRRYGLASLSQHAHAVQCAAQARAAGLGDAMVVAALLHDVGHMVHGLGEHPAAQGIDDRHEQVGADWLAARFGPEVAEPVRLHVAAKRYLCAIDAAYASVLTRDSVESLALQGGPMTATQAAAFALRPFASDAVLLRRIDDQAKDPDAPIARFADFAPQVVAMRRRADGGAG